MRNTLNSKNLIIGQKYWIIGQKYWILVLRQKQNNTNVVNYQSITPNVSNLKLEDALKYCTLKKTYNRNGCTCNFCFYPDDENDENDEIWYEIDTFLVEHFVFEEPDDCLISLYRIALQLTEVDSTFKIGYSSDIKQKIKESQEKNPHKWIF